MATTTEFQHASFHTSPSTAHWRARFSRGPHDAGHLLPPPAHRPDAAQFFAQSERELRAMRDQIIQDLIDDLHRMPGHWNPLGFLVWHLGVDAGGNSLRLHMWPAGERQVATCRPGVHCHAWYLSSLMLAGRYRDIHYNIIEHGYHSEADRIRERHLRKFRLAYQADGTSRLEHQGECVSLQVRGVHDVNVGTVHHIKDGVFHAPQVPAGQATMTLVIDSPCLGYDTTVVLDCGPEFPTRGRMPATVRNVDEARGVLAALPLHTA